MKDSSRTAEVVPVVPKPHGNADNLCTIEVHGYGYVGRIDEWAGRTMGVWIPPDTIVDTRRPEFAFLADRARADGTYRVKAMRLRGIVSYGLMVPVPEGAQLGDDCYERLGLSHYEPTLAHERREGNQSLFLGVEDDRGPSVQAPCYGLESLLRYYRQYEPSEPVLMTEKLDGANARFVYADGRLHAGSRTAWKREFADYGHVTLDYLTGKGVEIQRARAILDKLHAKPKQSLWWQVLRKTPALERFLLDNPGVVVYGEVYGEVNCIKYGFPDGNRFAGFDLWKGDQWADPIGARQLALDYGLPWVPVLHDSQTVPFDLTAIKAASEGPTLAEGARAGTIREGVVVHSLVGRKKMKVVSPTFLERYR